MLSLIFIKIVELSATACYIIPVVLLMRLALRRAPRLCSYALWVVVLVRLLCPFSLKGAVSLIPSRGAEAVTQLASQAVRLSMEDVQALSNASGETAAAAQVAASTTPTQIALLAASVLWLLGVAVMLGRGLVSSLRLRFYLQGTVSQEGMICRSDAIDTSFVLGVIHPRIYLPLSLSPQEEEYILLHERTHIRRKDHLTRLLAYLSLSLHWFNPLVWLAYYLSEKDMETACDEYVLNRLGRQISKPYSQSILTFASGQSRITMPLSFAGGSIKGRIRHILNYRKPAVWITTLAIVAAIAVGIGLLVSPSGKTSGQSNTEQAFLTSLFTTNQDGRWDTYQAADRSTEEAGTQAMEQYYSSLSAMCTEDGLASIAQNRLPYTYDSLAQEYGCSMEPKEITLTQGEDAVDFTVELTVTRDGEALGTVEQSGQLQLVQEGEESLVDSVWISNLSDLTDFLASA